MRPIFHPSIDDVRLEAILHALSDPDLRGARRFSRSAARGRPELRVWNAFSAAPGLRRGACAQRASRVIPKSSLSQHFKVLREAGPDPFRALRAWRCATRMIALRRSVDRCAFSRGLSIRICPAGLEAGDDDAWTEIVRTVRIGRHDPGQPHRDRADVPVFGGRWLHDRLASDPSRPSRAVGRGLLTIEATAVLPEGRISYADVGLYDDETEAAMARTLDERAAHGPTCRSRIQLGHAGRKASTEVPWKGGGADRARPSAHGWQTVAPSAIPSSSRPRAAGARRDGLARVRDAFAAAARRAARLGIDAVQLHGAHGYLLHQFLSPLSNRREDDYGGSLENRMRFPLEVFDAVRAAFPADVPVTMRVSGTDWVEGGWDIEQTIAFAQALEHAAAASSTSRAAGSIPARRSRSARTIRCRWRAR
jgi:DNA-binding transcriptional ArsR family regulator